MLALSDSNTISVSPSTVSPTETDLITSTSDASPDIRDLYVQITHLQGPYANSVLSLLTRCQSP